MSKTLFASNLQIREASLRTGRLQGKETPLSLSLSLSLSLLRRPEWFWKVHRASYSMVEHVWNVMAHAQKPDLVFQRNGRVHLNWRAGGGGQFSRLLAAEVCASAVVMVVMLDASCSEVECKTTGYTLHSHVSPSFPLPCVTACHQVSTEL